MHPAKGFGKFFGAMKLIRNGHRHLPKGRAQKRIGKKEVRYCSQMGKVRVWYPLWMTMFRTSLCHLKHLGVLKNGKEDTDTAKEKGWSGAMENYTLKTVKNKTELTVDQDIEDDYKDYFLSTWPKALEKLKALAEGGAEEGVAAAEESRASR